MKLRLPGSLRYADMRLGLPGAIGACVLALCLGLYVSVLQPAEQRRDAARLSATSLQTRLARAELNQGPPLDAQLSAFYRFFPGEQDATDAVGKIVAIAKRHGLVLYQADYKLETDKVSKLARFHMNLPLKGEYGTIRRFLSDVNAELPIVSLEQVQFERQKVGDAQVDAKVRLVVFLGRRQ